VVPLQIVITDMTELCEDLGKQPRNQFPSRA